MKKEIQLDFGKKIFPLIIMGLGVALCIAMLVTRLNMTAVVCVAFNCILAALITLSLIIKKKVYAPMVFSYAAVSLGVVLYFVIWGADAGFGAFSTGMNGYASYDFELF